MRLWLIVLQSPVLTSEAYLKICLRINSPSEILWFGARLRVYTQSEEIRIKSESAVRQQSFFSNEIQKQKITFIKIGYLRAREVDLQSGGTEWKLTEKGVDVGLAVIQC